ncbi:hypothetical protein BZG36_00212 [Bifiguratus adelaidae]|uniref:Bud22 domain-containing protein n=1 Tax=Bifiguratus adelaidae TaxID=1938954 RepID=A0A261Y8B5_9FUNG|nr:hypothetical protein BZG36_00212 [Bifiguratus adelaidae]
MDRKANLRWRINLLEAKLGKQAKLPRANTAANKKRSHAKAHGEDNNGAITEEQLKEQLQELLQRQLERKVHHARIEFRRALKKAKTFIIQRHVKHLKQAQHTLKATDDTSTQEKKIARFSKEIEQLKHINLEGLANQVLLDQVASAESLSSSKLLQNALMQQQSQKNSQSPAQEDNSSSTDATETHVRELLIKASSVQQAIQSTIASLSSIIQEEAEALSDTKDNMTPEPLAESADDVTQTIPTDQIPDDTSPTDPANGQSHAEKPPKKAKQKTPTKAVKRTQGIESDSLFMDSLKEDDEEPKPKKSKDERYYANNRNKKPEKEPVKRNRAGQRARQQKWEELYGKDAKHIQLQRKEKKERKERYNPPPKAVPNDPTLHPSWQAKKAQSEAISKALSGAPAKNKIVFD